MRPVAVIGIGKTHFGAFADRDLRSLAVEAGRKCLDDANVTPSQIEAFYLGNFAGPAVGAAALHFLPQYPSSGALAVSGLLVLGLGGLVGVRRMTNQ